MGIQNFSRFLASFGVKRAQPFNSYDHLLIDGNGYLYSRKNVSFVVSRLRNELLNLKGQHKPRRSVFFTLDGVPPSGKIIQQHQRRACALDGAKIYAPKMLATPGTHFMSQIDAELKQIGPK